MKDIPIRGCLFVLGTPVVVVILMIGFFWLIFHDVHVRYRLTVEVQDGDQIKTGSSVINVSYEIEDDLIWTGPHDYVAKVVGYAPTVDLGKKGLLFLTLDEWRPRAQVREPSKQFPCSFGVIGCLPSAAYNMSGLWQRRNTSEEKARLRELLRQSGPRDVPFAMLPSFGRFLDINDPLLLVPVSPGDLAASFGPGVELKRVILQLTDDPVTPPPAIWPQWLKEKGQMRGKLRGYFDD
jgi:hypothetical protein